MSKQSNSEAIRNLTISHRKTVLSFRLPCNFAIDIDEQYFTVLPKLFYNYTDLLLSQVNKRCLKGNSKSIGSEKSLKSVISQLAFWILVESSGGNGSANFSNTSTKIIIFSLNHSERNISEIARLLHFLASRFQRSVRTSNQWRSLLVYLNHL